MEFKEIPPLGTKIMRRKNRAPWVLIDYMDYVRRDGKKSAILFWCDGYSLGKTGLKFKSVGRVPLDLSDKVKELKEQISSNVRQKNLNA